MLVNSGVRTGGGPIHFYGAPVSGIVERSKWGEAGALRNFYAGEATVISGNSIANKSGYPVGYRHPYSWSMAPKGGGLSSYQEAQVVFTEYANGAAAIGIESLVAITFSATATGKGLGYLIGNTSFVFSEVSELTALAALASSPSFQFSQTGALSGKAILSANTTFIFTVNSGQGVAIANASGDTSFQFNESGNLIGVFSANGTSSIVFVAQADGKAFANLQGNSSFTFSNSAAAKGLARLQASDSIVFVGEGVISALGKMVATPIDQTLSPTTIAEAVWNSSASSFNLDGTLGEKLNDAGSAGNPWASSLSDNQTDGTFGAFIQKLLTTAKFLGLK